MAAFPGMLLPPDTGGGTMRGRLNHKPATRAGFMTKGTPRTPREGQGADGWGRWGSYPPGAQQRQKIDAALAVRARKPRKVFIPDVRADAVLSLVPGSRIVHMDVLGETQTNAKNLILLPVELLLALRDQPVDLRWGNGHSPLTQRLQDQRLRHHCVVVEIEHKAAQDGPKMTLGRRCGQLAIHHLAVRCEPFFQLVQDGFGLNHQLLNCPFRKPLERASGGHIHGLDDHGLVGHALGFLPAPLRAFGALRFACICQF